MPKINGRSVADIVDVWAAGAKATANPPAMTPADAEGVIAKALHIDPEAASMVLYGLCATRRVRWVDSNGKLVDEDEVTIADFEAKLDLVSAKDIDDVLEEWSTASQDRAETWGVFTALAAEGHVPGRGGTSWKAYEKLFRLRLPGRRRRGFRLRTLKRRHAEFLRAK
jgi:hypothetical protein